MRNKIFFGIMLGMVLSGLLAMYGCKPSGEKQAPEERSVVTAAEDSLTIVSLTPDQFRNAGIQLGNMEQRKLNDVLPVSGMVDVPPQSRISVTFPYGGFIRKINVLEGDYVKKGSLLARLENPEYVDLQESYLKNKSVLDYARQEYNRQKELYQADVAAGKSYQKARSDYESLEASVKALAQKLNMLGIPAETLKPDNIRSSVDIVAPDNGYVTRIAGNRGKYMDPQQELLEIDNIRNVHIDLTIYEKDINSVQPGQRVRFRLSGSQAEHKAKITLIGREIGPDRSVVLHAMPEDPNLRLLPGAYVQAHINRENALSDVLPEAAVVRSEGKQYIFVKEKDASYRFQMIPVQTGTEDNGYLQVELPGTRQIADSSIVVKGAFALLSALKNTGDDD
ncbi:efflux RND transporter periplasmic adaptor subunit [Compostibacter hankyongensis]|uniref:Efflux RND transporter periplasmic adaptor subunit n=1 Tax=Compostibacter hankyongensis TaxID=1007089 RepID=A0ABP8FQW9_9BACT